MSTFIIYKTTNLVNGKIYIGQHFTSANDGYLGSGKLIKLSIKKNGKHNFSREIIEFCNEENINEREDYWIEKLDSRNPEKGYNIARGGIGVRINLNGKNNPMFGRNQSQESRLKMSQNHCDFLGRKNPNFGKGKYVYKFLNINSKEITETKSLTEFCRQNDLNLNSLDLVKKSTKIFKLKEG